MLEMLLFQYKDQFGSDFPLELFENVPEIEVINILYECVQNSTPYSRDMTIPENRFQDAPKK